VSEKSLIYNNKFGNKFEISTRVKARLKRYVQSNESDPEAGGVLLGRFIINTDDVVVDRISVPMEGDERSRNRYFRSAKPHQDLIRKVWERSEGKCNYLGEWHTHPVPDPSPSIIDLLQWKKKLLFDKYDSDFLFFAIIGINHIAVWQGYRRSLVIEKLKQIRPKKSYSL
jgi:integrative and conjugative element protein (TIGR02256 family)